MQQGKKQPLAIWGYCGTNQTKLTRTYFKERAKHIETFKGFPHCMALIKRRQKMNENQLSFWEKLWRGGSRFIVADIDREWCLFANSKAGTALTRLPHYADNIIFQQQVGHVSHNLSEWVMSHEKCVLTIQNTFLAAKMTRWGWTFLISPCVVIRRE